MKMEIKKLVTSLRNEIKRCSAQFDVLRTAQDNAEHALRKELSDYVIGRYFKLRDSIGPEINIIKVLSSSEEGRGFNCVCVEYGNPFSDRYKRVVVRKKWVSAWDITGAQDCEEITESEFVKAVGVVIAAVESKIAALKKGEYEGDAVAMIGGISGCYK